MRRVKKNKKGSRRKKNRRLNRSILGFCGRMASLRGVNSSEDEDGDDETSLNSIYRGAITWYFYGGTLY